MEAYLYLYPLTVMDATRRFGTSSAAARERTTINGFTHLPGLSIAELQEAVRPNLDVLFSVAWLDLTNGPLTVTVPETGGRYYLLPMLDMWSEVFATVGSRTTGTAAARFLVVPPGWQGSLPRGLERIEAPTPFVWILGRIQIDGANDHAAARRIQDGFTITPAPATGKKAGRGATTRQKKAGDEAARRLDVENMEAAEFFAYAAELLKANPPRVADQPVVARMRRIGIQVGKSFELSKADPAVRRALQRVPADAFSRMRAQLPKVGRVVNGWEVHTDSLGAYGANYLKRAIVAGFGLGANRPEDVVQAKSMGDSDGNPLTGAGKYALHFGKDELPPVAAFWSMTLYDGAGLPVPNPLKRYAIGSHNDVRYGPDGSLDLYFQKEHPGKERESNWLPIPDGQFELTLRLYSPKVKVLDGRWSPPPVKRMP